MTGQANLEFREAVIPDDIEALCDFDRKVFGAYPEDLFLPEDWAELESYWLMLDGNAIGCLALKGNVDYDEEPRPGCLYIESTGVLQEHQGQGFGARMKEWQIEYARHHGFELIVTNARQSNSASISLNQKFGFRTREVVPDYYSDPDEPAVVMELEVGTVRST
jgi:ribosomal protein S18 acetylase RimI-like enzyme